MVSSITGTTEFMSFFLKWTFPCWYFSPSFPFLNMEKKASNLISLKKKRDKTPMLHTWPVTYEKFSSRRTFCRFTYACTIFDRYKWMFYFLIFIFWSAIPSNLLIMWDWCVENLWKNKQKEKQMNYDLGIRIFLSIASMRKSSILKR